MASARARSAARIFFWFSGFSRSTASANRFTISWVDWNSTPNFIIFSLETRASSLPGSLVRSDA